jgi:hypothetical protein
MLGLPVTAWLRFFAGGFAAGALLLLVPIKPLPAIGVFEMITAAAGLVVVSTYARYFAPVAWRRLRVRARRTRRALGRVARSLQARPAS